MNIRSASNWVMIFVFRIITTMARCCCCRRCCCSVVIIPSPSAPSYVSIFYSLLPFVFIVLFCTLTGYAFKIYLQFCSRCTYLIFSVFFFFALITRQENKTFSVVSESTGSNIMTIIQIFFFISSRSCFFFLQIHSFSYELFFSYKIFILYTPSLPGEIFEVKLLHNVSCCQLLGITMYACACVCCRHM